MRHEGHVAPAGRPTQERVLGAAELLALLDREIDYAHRRSQWPGWTPWALLTALSALLWGFASQIDLVTSPSVVFWSGAAALMIIEVLRRGRQFLESSRALDDDGRVLVSSDVLGEHRASLVLELIYAGVLLWGIGRFADGVAPWASAVTRLWAALMGLSAVVGLLYSLWPVPFPAGVSRLSPVRLLLQGLPVLVPALGAFAYITFIDVHSVEDIRVGVLIGAAALVLLEVAREPDEPPLVSELVEVRRGVSLGTIGVAEGAERTTIIMQGLKLEDYVQQDARRLLRAMESLQSAIVSFRPVVEDIRHHATLFEQKTVPDEQAWSRLMTEWEQKGDEADRRSRHAERWQRRYARRLEFAAAIARLWHLPYEGQALVAEIRPQVDRVMTEYKRVVDEYSTALARLEQALRTAGLVE